MTSIKKGFRKDNCHCCPPFVPFDLTQGNPLDVNYIYPADPPEVSDGHGRVIIYERITETGLTEETVLSGAVSGSVSVAAEGIGGDHPGSRRLTVDISTTNAEWVAGVIFWDDTGFSYDPNERGSLSRVRAHMAWRWYDEFNALQRSFSSESDSIGQPYPFIGAVIEQGGNRFYSYDVDSFSTQPEDDCWHQMAGGAFDGNGIQYVGRLATAAEGWGTGTGVVPDRAVGSFKLGRCDDRFASLTNGVFDFDDRPDISYDSAVSRPVTKFGIFIGLMSEVQDTLTATPRAAADSYTWDVLVDDLWLDYGSWGLPKVFEDDIGQPADYGTTYLDEPLDSIPPWTQSGAAIRNPSPEIGDESCASGGIAELINGFVGNKQTFGGEYTAFRMSTAPTTPVCGETGTITVEFTWYTIDERDHVLPNGDTEDPDLSRRLWSGVWLDEAFRFLATKEGDMWDHNCGNMRWEMQTYIDPDGGRRINHAVNSTYGGDPYVFSSEEKDSARLEGENCGADHSKGRAAPMDGDRITIMIRRQFTNTEATERNNQYITNVSNGVYEQPPKFLAYPEARWLIYVWVNGRVLHMGFFRSIPGSFNPWTPSPLAGDVLWFGGNGGGPLTIGLLGMCGGRWSNLRLKVRP